MSSKRWFALLAAVVLLVVSLISQLGSTVATTDFEKTFDSMFNIKEIKEKVIEDGTGNNKIAVVHLDGIIQSDSEGLLNTSAYNHKRFLKMLDEAAKDNRVDGIIMRVNTPGGGVVESAEIHDKVVEIQEEYQKPVYVSMGNTAASGGYYIAAPAEKIIAHAATLTGSIGVIMEAFNITEFADKHGIDFNTIKSGEFKDIMSISRKMTDEEREILQTMIDELYDEFVQVIVDGRDLSEAEVRALGDGRVYTGKQAMEAALVDELGSLDETIEFMKEDYGWDNATVIEYEKGFDFNPYLGGVMQNVFGKETDLMGIKDMLRESNAPRAMYLYSK